MTPRSKWLAVPLTAVIAASLAGCGGGNSGSDVLQAARDRCTLRVALTGANPPWSLVDEKNQTVGYDVDVANEIAERGRAAARARGHRRSLCSASSSRCGGPPLRCG